MPKGVWTRTEEQMQQIRELGKRPKTLIQIETARKTGRRVGLSNKGKPKSKPKTQKQIESAIKCFRGTKIFADDIVKHHPDLCHGAERPDDVTSMTNSEHISLHNRLRVENGTHNWLSKNRK